MKPVPICSHCSGTKRETIVIRSATVDQPCICTLPPLDRLREELRRKEEAREASGLPDPGFGH